jgi:hypothetical protein
MTAASSSANHAGLATLQRPAVDLGTKLAVATQLGSNRQASVLIPVFPGSLGEIPWRS